MLPQIQGLFHEACDSSVTENNPGLPIQYWVKPASVFAVVNVDFAIDHAKNAIGLGMIMRNDRGEFVAARSHQEEGIVEPYVGE